MTNIKQLILDIITKNGEIQSSEIVKKTGFTRAYINRFFNQLKEEGKIVLIGKANRAKYTLANRNMINTIQKDIASINITITNENIAEDVILDDIKKETGIFTGTPPNIANIISYSFSEMLNNAIEHSESKKIKIEMKKDETQINFNVIDQGIGIYNNLVKKKHLKNEFEAIQDLLKGKLTTQPEEHSGEGIFFTSKIAGIFTIQSGTKKIIFHNDLKDIFIKTIKKRQGTKITFSITLNSDKKLEDVFERYTDGSFQFNKTEVAIKLYNMNSEYISRSQARRLLSGLENFKKIILDFDQVDTAGQAFADEIFRVWQNKNKDKTLEVKNANDNVVFMLKRAGWIS
jgi:anti-sigma regulatory factor (Ser/Thr protein kinase)